MVRVPELPPGVERLVVLDMQLTGEMDSAAAHYKLLQASLPPPPAILPPNLSAPPRAPEPGPASTFARVQSGSLKGGEPRKGDPKKRKR